MAISGLYTISAKLCVIVSGILTSSLPFRKRKAKRERRAKGREEEKRKE
jgi:hypothetical protein